MAITSNTSPSAQAQSKSKSFLTASINELVAINFLVPPAILEPLLPKGLELSYMADETYVSLICNVVRRSGFLSNPFSSGITHLSLQYYVRRTADPESRRGVCQIRNFTSASAGSWGAKLEMDSKKMKMKRDNSGFSKGGVPEVEYQWKVEENWNKLRIKGRNRIKNTGPKTKVGFILDHKNIYQDVKGKTIEIQVKHEPWNAWDAAHANFTCDVQQMFGKEFVKPLARRPSSVFVSNAGKVDYFKPKQIA